MTHFAFIPGNRAWAKMWYGIFAALLATCIAPAQTITKSAQEMCKDPTFASSPLCASLPGIGATPEVGTPRPVLPTPPAVTLPVPSPVPVSAPARQTDATPARSDAGPAPVPRKSDFQVYAAQVLGTELDIFGHTLFARTPTTFAPVDRIPVPSNYVLGPGDEIQLRSWGQINFDIPLVVDREGMIYIPQVGPLRVAGLKLQELQPFIRGQMSRVFRNFELAVNLGQLRSIQIYVVGAARRPGMYTVSSLATLVNAIFASGGPSEVGSYRKIELRRQGKTVTVLDLYRLLVQGDKSSDHPLEPGDIVFIPSVGPQVALGGSVKNPAIYELGAEATLKDLLELAGGVSPVADLNRVIIDRIADNGERRVQLVSLARAKEPIPLRAGDVIRFQPVPPQVRNSVILRGHVSAPGRYPWFPGMRLKDLIRSKEDLLSREYWRVRNRAGSPPAGDTGPNVTQETPARPLSIGRGFDYPEINWAYATIERKDQTSLSYSILPFHLGKLLLEGDDKENYPLEPDDIVTVYTLDDFRTAIGNRTRVVTIEGEIRTAGRYTISAHETLGSLLQRAGGLTQEAYIPALEFYRDSVEQLQNKRLEELVQQLEAEIAQQARLRQTAASGEQSAQEADLLLAQQQRVVNNLRKVRAKGRLVLPLLAAGSSLRDYEDLLLEDGDRIYVPPRPSVVNVFGEVTNPGTFVFQDGVTVKALLRQAGGAGRFGDTKRMFIIRSDGTVVDAKSVGRRKLQRTLLTPGDTVVVPPRWPRGPFLRDLRDWSQVFAQLAFGAAAINVLR